MRNYKDIPIWKDVTDEQWNDWKWQVRNRITTLEELKQVAVLTLKKKRVSRNP
jgi:lysine 2,3-aminomutase